MQTIEVDQCVPRAEIEEKFESLRRELAAKAEGDAAFRTRIDAKLDQLLSGKLEDARAMGALQEQVRTLFNTVQSQGQEIAALRAKIEEARAAPKDSLLRIVGELGKLLIAGAIGYLLRK